MREALDLDVQMDLRLGLIVPRAAVSPSRLPGWQAGRVERGAMRRGRTVRQTELLDQGAIDAKHAAARESSIAGHLDGPAQG